MGLNAQQALLFAFVYECPSWAKLQQTAAGEFYVLSKAKIIEELPVLTDKTDTAYRLLKQLEQAGVIDLSSTRNVTLVRLTAKGKEWNKKLDGSEKFPTSEKIRPRYVVVGKNPTYLGRKSDQGRKKSEQGSEISPTNQVTSNQGTNQDTSQYFSGEAAPAPAGMFVGAEQDSGPRCEIPADMPGPKDPTCKTYRTWANYAIAYRNRHKTWPLWNESVAGKLSKFIARVGQADAPKVAAFFVLRVNDAAVTKACHPIGMLLANAEGYHTQWQTDRPTTSTQARQQEHTAANLSAAEQALAEQRARRAAHADA